MYSGILCGQKHRKNLEFQLFRDSREIKVFVWVTIPSKWDFSQKNEDT